MANTLIDKVSTIGDLAIEIWSDDLQHAIDGHPEVTLDKVKNTLKESLVASESAVLNELSVNL